MKAMIMMMIVKIIMKILLLLILKIMIKYLINRVEYEFFSAKTMDRVYASLCDPYEILISYPLVFNKKRYNNYEGGINKNEYKKGLK